MKENLIFKENVSDMDKISIKIRLLYNEMGKAEKQVADWIEANPGKIISLSIVELAEQCRCSEATIVRFSKRLGMSGFQELKISLAAEGGGSSVVSENPPPPKQEVIKAIHRQTMFPAKTLKSDAEIDAYVEKIRDNMKQLLKGCDGIKLN